MPDSIPTLDDVASRAGVSTATVSRCLNTPERVVKKTRDRVMRAVEELGYTPNFGARMMASKRTMTIGAIVPTMENAIFARGLQAFQEELQQSGYTLLVASSGYQPELEQAQIKALVARGADGLLLIGHERDPKIYAYLKTQDVPVVIAWTFDAAITQTSIGFDNHKAMYALVEEVLRIGHRQIGVISGPIAGNDRVRQRIHGTKAAVAAQGLSTEALEIAETTYDMTGGAAAFDQLMTSKSAPTAIVCFNDVLAVGALKQAQSRGFDVPFDVSITGFADIELASIVVPALTTVHVPHREMGQCAAHEIIQMVEEKNPGRSLELATSVKLRESLMPPRR